MAALILQQKGSIKGLIVEVRRPQFIDVKSCEGSLFFLLRFKNGLDVAWTQIVIARDKMSFPVGLNLKVAVMMK